MIEKHLTSVALMAMACWVPLCGLLFMMLPTRSAVLGAFLTGYLFLPQGEMKVPGILPDLDRNTLVHGVVLLCVAAFDLRRLAALRPRLLDLPVLVWVLAGCASSVTNGLGLYDGLSQAMTRGIYWGIPWAIGRAYFSDIIGLRHLALTIVAGGLLYAPLCLYEVRMSPQLHSMVYGYHAHAFYQTHRLGGWRPTVFLQHGLAVGMWMTGATLLGAWLLLTGAIRPKDRTIAVVLFIALAITTFTSKSFGALVLLVVGLAALIAARMLGRAWPIVLLLLVPPVYATARMTEAWTGGGLVRALEVHVSGDRAQSLAFRLDNETLLSRKALEQPALGWSGYGRALVEDERGEKRTIVDGLWIHALGQNGLIGLTALYAMLLAPIAVWCRGRGEAALRGEPEALGLAALCALLAIDSLMNAMFNPFAILAVSGLGACAVTAGRAALATARPEDGPIVGYLPGRVALA